MLNRDQITKAMQYERFHVSKPLNTTESAPIQITYQYAGGSAPKDLPSTSKISGWQPFTTAEKASFEAALAHIESYLNIDFVQVKRTSDPDLNVGAAHFPGNIIGSGGYNISYQGDTITSWDGFVAYDTTLDLSSNRYTDLILHELGHALGLQHPFEASPALPNEYESNLYSLMSYTANPLNGKHSDALMLFDVLALQDIWGAASHNEGNSRYSGCRTYTVDSLWDSGGIDTLDATGRSTGVTLDLRQGAFSSFDADHDVVITFGTEIENAYGAKGKDRIIGNDLDNLLRGHGDRDLLVGKGGDDRMEGGSGGDTLWGDHGDDVMFGGRGGDRLRGGAGEDRLIGNRGQDRLDGQAGDDLLIGGRGRDIFIFKNHGGNDTVSDFKSGKDRLNILGHGDRDDLLDQARDTEKGVLFDFGPDDSLLLANVTLGSLGEDFLI
ncbi:M10 family metallopeptidase [Pseudophaeobacter sp.]|uniref:M10 family metallopeptidase n=1 Tax=Pseudophaeobacter sp. TaxID=1971739 RepID=UPI00329777BE